MVRFMVFITTFNNISVIYKHKTHVGNTVWIRATIYSWKRLQCACSFLKKWVFSVQGSWHHPKYKFYLAALKSNMINNGLSLNYVLPFMLLLARVLYFYFFISNKHQRWRTGYSVTVLGCDRCDQQNHRWRTKIYEKIFIVYTLQNRSLEYCRILFTPPVE
jgi:hypothetical protein